MAQQPILAILRCLVGLLALGLALPAIAQNAPTIELTSPANNTVLAAPATITVTAAASPGASGSAIRLVDFYADTAQGELSIGYTFTAPYSITWDNVPPGSYDLTAIALDYKGKWATSAPIHITVGAPPTVSLTAPAANTQHPVGSNLVLTANAADSDGTIAQVVFYQNGTLIGAATQAPYAVTWNNLPAGTHTLAAIATDNHGLSATSAPVPITVGSNSQTTKIYYLHSDHLDTPREVTDEQGQIVWRNGPLTEPFGNSPPEEDPDGDGVPFTLNLRFPGQYFDKETNLHYNYYRDYDPLTGRYIQADPIGLEGGINLYLYANANPLTFTDPLGLNPAAGCAAGAWAGPLGCGVGAAIGTAAIGGAAITAIMSIPGDTPKTIPRDIWWPDRMSGKWSCKARADCNDNIPANCPEDPTKRFAFGGGIANDLGTARNIAKANATSNLQCQPKHVSCKCTGPKGEQYSGGC